MPEGVLRQMAYLDFRGILRHLAAHCTTCTAHAYALLPATSFTPLPPLLPLSASYLPHSSTRWPAALSLRFKLRQHRAASLVRAPVAATGCWSNGSCLAFSVRASSLRRAVAARVVRAGVLALVHLRGGGTA